MTKAILPPLASYAGHMVIIIRGSEGKTLANYPGILSRDDTKHIPGEEYDALPKGRKPVIFSYYPNEETPEEKAWRANHSRGGGMSGGAQLVVGFLIFAIPAFFILNHLDQGDVLGRNQFGGYGGYGQPAGYSPYSPSPGMTSVRQSYVPLPEYRDPYQPPYPQYIEPYIAPPQPHWGDPYGGWRPIP